jgi:hypothetical protein
MALRFEDPPASRSVASAYTADLEELKQHPNRWAIIAAFPANPVHGDGDTKAANLAQAIRQGKTPVCQPARSFEVKQRRVDDEHRVYVRYVGEQETER